MRKKLKDLTFVDRSRFKEGVSFDSKNQLIHFAHGASKLNTKKLAIAVKNAGFDPVYLYQTKSKKVVKTRLTP